MNQQINVKRGDTHGSWSWHGTNMLCICSRLTASTSTSTARVLVSETGLRKKQQKIRNRFYDGLWVHPALCQFSPILYLPENKSKTTYKPTTAPYGSYNSKSYHSPTPSYSSLLSLPAADSQSPARAGRNTGRSSPCAACGCGRSSAAAGWSRSAFPACPELPRATGHGRGAELRCGRPQVAPPAVVRTSSSLSRAVVRLGSSSPAPDHVRPRPARWMVLRQRHRR
jgi:hypothetical protein